MNEELTAMPHALGIEKYLLSCMLRDNIVEYSRFTELGGNLSMFYLPAHVLICGIIADYSAKSIQLELVGLVQSCIDKGILDDLGGASAITELFSYAHHNIQFERFVEILKIKFITRNLITISNNDLLEIETLQDLESALASRESQLSDLSTLLYPKSNSTVQSSIEFVVKQFQELVTSDSVKSMFGHITGYDKLDELTLGLQKGEIFVIGARPSMGKSALLFNIACNICVKDKIPSLLFSCEMTKDKVVSRMVYSMAKLPFQKLADRSIVRYLPTKSEMIRMKESITAIKSAPLYIEEKGGITIDDLCATARRHKRQYGIKFIGVDYLQLITCNSKAAKQSKEAEISIISARLKALAKELDLPIVVLSQLNRNAATSKPRMSDLRSSGSIEQDADVIGLLYRLDYEGKTENVGEAELNITKNRNGPTGVIELEWDDKITQFTEKKFIPL